MPTIEERAQTLRRHGNSQDVVAAILGVTPGQVAANTANPAVTIPDPSPGGGSGAGGTAIVPVEFDGVDATPVLDGRVLATEDTILEVVTYLDLANTDAGNSSWNLYVTPASGSPGQFLIQASSRVGVEPVESKSFFIPANWSFVVYYIGDADLPPRAHGAAGSYRPTGTATAETEVPVPVPGEIAGHAGGLQGPAGADGADGATGPPGADGGAATWDSFNSRSTPAGTTWSQIDGEGWEVSPDLSVPCMVTIAASRALLLDSGDKFRIEVRMRQGTDPHKLVGHQELRAPTAVEPKSYYLDTFNFILPAGWSYYIWTEVSIEAGDLVSSVDKFGCDLGFLEQAASAP